MMGMGGLEVLVVLFVGFIVLGPYMSVSLAKFHDDLINDNGYMILEID